MDILYKKVLSANVLNKEGDVHLEGVDIVNDSMVAENLNKCILKLYGKYLSEDGRFVDYSGIAASEEYKEFLEETYHLKQVDLNKLTEVERKAFFLNIYNALVIHGNIEVGVPNDFISRTSFYQRTAYQIGANVFTLDDIEHGIIRGNRKHPAFFITSHQFGSHDSRKTFSLTSLDPRIHFALVCGARSCPPIRVYNSNNLELGLNLAASNFCQDESNFKIVGNKVMLSQIFKWYFADFSSERSNVELLQYLTLFVKKETKEEILKLLETNNFTVIYVPYDWSLNTHNNDSYDLVFI